MSFVTHLECSRCQQHFSHQKLHNLCPACHYPLLVRYRLGEVVRQLTRQMLLSRPADMWRYLEVMPISDRSEAVCLGEGMTPLLRMRRLEQDYRGTRLYTKDEGVNPTGSFKARGLAAAVSLAKKLGARKLAIPSAGNAGGALAAYGSHAGLETYVFVPKDTPLANIVETQMTATYCELIEGVITDAGKIVAERRLQEGWFDVSTLKEPYRIEGKKTMGYEIAEQMEWELPEVILYPTGGGTGLIGMWKAFDEMEQLGWIGSRRPRMVAVQSEGCAPIVRAFEKGEEFAEAWSEPETFASGIRVPKAIGDFLILDAVRQSQGIAVAVSEKAILEAIRELGRREGLFYCPEGAACWAAFRHLHEKKWIHDGDRVVVFNTGAGTKYVDSIRKMERNGAAGFSPR